MRPFLALKPPRRYFGVAVVRDYYSGETAIYTEPILACDEDVALMHLEDAVYSDIAPDTDPKELRRLFRLRDPSKEEQEQMDDLLERCWIEELKLVDLADITNSPSKLGSPEAFWATAYLRANGRGVAP